MKSLILWRIPRTGTTSIRRGLVAAGVEEMVARNWDRSKTGFVTFGHSTPAEVLYQQLATEAELHEMPQLIIVRNPWERLVSLFQLFHQQARGSGLRELAERYAPTFAAYVDWCVSCERVTEYHARNLQAARQTDWLLPEAAYMTINRSTIYMRFEHPFTYDGKVNPAYYVGRFEELPLVWEWLCNWFGCTGKLPHHNGSRRGPYQEYYSPTDAAKIGEHYACEIEMFGFQFEGG